MRKIALLLVAILGASLASAVERAGIQVSTPSGWRVAVGTCTGDAISIYPADKKDPVAVSLVVGSRRYRDREAEFITSGEWSDFYQFEDVLAQVGRSYEQELTWLVARPLKVDKFTKVMLCSFHCRVSDSIVRRGRMLFVELPQKNGVLFIDCSFAPSSEDIANLAFENAAISVIGECPAILEARKDRPNQSLEPTATAVTHPADAGCAPAVAVAHH